MGIIKEQERQYHINRNMAYGIEDLMDLKENYQ
jgi:hypothetical protein